MLQNLPIKLTQIAGPLWVFCLAMGLYLGEILGANDFITSILNYQRDLISQGELWRLLSGNLLHTNFNHLLLNLAAVILLWALHGRFYQQSRYLQLVTAIALISNISLFYFSPHMQQYVGLSGVLHGLLLWGACQDIRYKDKTGYLLLLALTAKIIYEQIFGASPNMAVLINANVAIDAHLWGAIAGTICFAFSLLFTKTQPYK